MTRALPVQALLVGMLLILPSALPAQVGVAGGPSIAVGDMAEVTSLGFHGGIVVNIGEPVMPLPLRADLMFQTLPAAEDVDEGQSRDKLFATVQARLATLPPQERLYISAGAGAYADTDDWSVRPGVNLGGGLELDVGAIRSFAEVRYHNGLGSGATSFIPITFGILF